MNTYQARLGTPFGVLGIRTREGALTGIDFLPAGTASLDPNNALADEVCRQLQAYLASPQSCFALPLNPSGTPFQIRVWQALGEIPVGETLTYGALARQLGSSPRAVGGACGANPIAVIIPCHRVVGSHGLGGFMHHAGGGPLAIKRWLLEHEHVRLRSAG